MSTPEEQMIKDQQAKLELSIRAIADHCAESSEFADIRTIAIALQKGDKLVGSIVSGGQTNYAYKIQLEKQPDVAIFCKICFSFALWNPDRSQQYDLKRVDNEFEVMNRFKNMMGDDAPIATPYFCLDVEDMKLIGCQYANSSDEQWANQFIDGQVDRRLIPEVAKFLAILNTSEVDPMFNDNVRPCMQNVMGLGKSMIQDIANSTGDTEDKAVLYCRQIGAGRSGGIIDGMEEHYMRRDALIHSDTHVFNILVEPKPSIEKLQTFGPKGEWVLCDWEMAFCGDIGRDVGIWQAWPLACAFHHAVGGHKKEAYHMLDCCVEFFDAYAKTIIEECGKDQEYLLKTFRSSLGWISYFTLVGYYLLGLWSDCLPTEGLSEADKVKAKGSMGFTGARLAEIGFNNEQPDLTLDGLRALFKEIIINDIEELLEYAATIKGVLPRRGSVLRMSGRRISDASGMEEAAELVKPTQV